MNPSTSLPAQLLLAGQDALPLTFNRGEALDVSTGYALQGQGLQQRQARQEQLSGWKVAFAGVAAQHRFGLSEPVYGALTDAMAVSEDQSVDLSKLIRPKLEIEVAFILGQDLLPDFYSDEALLAAISEVAPAFEIADSRWRDWIFNAGAFLADNAAAALYCLGYRQQFVPERHLQMNYRLQYNGEALGTGVSALGATSPQSILCWLIRRLLADRQPLRAGQVILSGALLPPLDIQPGLYRLSMLGTDTLLRFHAGSHKG